MANSGKSRLAALRSEQLPSSVTVGKFTKYQDAQGAVDLLAERGFPVQNLAIVGTDLRQVEHVVGTLSYARVAASGALQGLFYGVFLGFLLMLFGHEHPMAAFLTSVPLGVAFWMILSIVGFSRRGGHRSFTAVGQLVAGSYDLVCAPQEAGEARRLLGGSSQRPSLRPVAPEQPYFPHHGNDPRGAQGQPQAPSSRPPYSDGSANGSGPGHDAPAPTGREPWGRPAAPQGTPGQNPSEAAASPDREQARDFKDLPDGRPRFGIRDENGRGSSAAGGEHRTNEGTDEPNAR